MYRVLVPVDRHDSRAGAQVDAVLEMPAAAGDLAVDVLYVHDGVSAADVDWAAGEGFADAYTDEMADQVKELDRLPASVETAVARLEASDHEFRVHERTGEPAREILDLAAELDSDAIVVGADTRSPVGKVLFGSVAQAVILDSDRPVTVVPDTGADE